MANSKHKCPICGKTKASTNFYLSNSRLYQNNKNQDDRAMYPWCKDCMTYEFDRYAKVSSSSKETFLHTCVKFDIPLDEGMIIGAVENKKSHPFKAYMRQVNSLGGNNGTADAFRIPTIWITQEEDGKSTVEANIAGAELRKKWGEYEYSVLLSFEEKYEFLKNNYKEQTNMHTEALLKYVRYAVLEEKANEKGDTSQAKIYNDLANKAATAAKINPSQLSKADLSDGLNSFSELSLAIEEAVDIVKILPKFKFRPNDALDFNIWCYVNYERNLNGLPEVEYSDIYKFYDERVKEYVKQYGDPYHLFEDDPMMENRPKIEKFIKPFAEEV